MSFLTPSLSKLRSPNLQTVRSEKVAQFLPNYSQFKRQKYEKIVAEIRKVILQTIETVVPLGNHEPWPSQMKRRKLYHYAEREFNENSFNLGHQGHTTERLWVKSPRVLFYSISNVML